LLFLKAADPQLAPLIDVGGLVVVRFMFGSAMHCVDGLRTFAPLFFSEKERILGRYEWHFESAK